MASRRGFIGWMELEVPPPPTNRRGLVGWMELEVPDLPRRGILGWLEMEVPDFQQFPSTAFIQGFQRASEAVAALAVVDDPVSHPYLQALSVALKEVAAQGEPVTGTQSGTPGKLIKYAGSTRIRDSLIAESGSVLTASGSLIVNGDHTVNGILSVAAGASAVSLSAVSGGGTDPVVLFRTSAVTRALIGAAAVAGDLMLGSGVGDLILRTQGGNLRVTLTSGSNQTFAITPTGIDHIGVHKIVGVQVLGPRKTGYVAMTGTANRGTVFDTATVTTAQLAQRVKALQDDLMSHGAIGA